MSYKYLQLSPPRDNDLLKRLFELGFTNAEYIEFNILFKNPGDELSSLLKKYRGNLIGKSHVSEDDRFYSTKYGRLSFPMSEELKEMMLERLKSEFSGFVIEDPSFIKDSVEIIGSITHENLYKIHDSLAVLLDI